jgi:dGTPase
MNNSNNQSIELSTPELPTLTAKRQTPRERRERQEHELLATNATLADQSKGRVREESPCPVRTCFRRDVDRIVHSKAFKRLEDKTQVFLAPQSAHYRTRLTHTIEVSRVASSIANALRLNEDLTEAIAFGHDLGHTPFGHAGERALERIVGYFRHNEQSLRVVDYLEKDGQGLNLCFETRDGIVNHTSKGSPATPEGKVVQIADRLAYVCHDTDDAIRAGVITAADLPDDVTNAIGTRYSQRMNSLIMDVIEYSESTGGIAYSPEMSKILTRFYDFLNEAVYTNPTVKSEETKVYNIMELLYSHFFADPDTLPKEHSERLNSEPKEQVVADYIAGMTDRFAISAFEQMFVPAGWRV